jgi:PEGA domain
MSAPLIELSSVSSSGYTDGLGRRVLAFDRETGVMLEQLRLRPELAAFEAGIRERVAQLAGFKDDCFPTLYRTERDAETGELMIVSGFVPGTRLSDLIDTAEIERFVPGVDVAIGFLLSALPALSALHTTTGFAHGLIDPARTVVTPAGHAFLLDPALGKVMERLGLSRQRLWTSFGIAVPPSVQAAQFDAASDMAQVALTAVMLVIGRRLRDDEYPDGIARLLVEVADVAQIRGSAAFAAGLQRILQRSLPLPSRRPYANVDEMIFDVRILVRREIGADACRAALIEFVTRMDAAFSLTTSADGDEDARSWPAEEEEYDGSAAEAGQVDDVPALPSHEEVVEGPIEFEISLDDISIARPMVSTEPIDVVYDLPSLYSIELLHDRKDPEPLSTPSEIHPDSPSTEVSQLREIDSHAAMSVIANQPAAPSIEEPVPAEIVPKTAVVEEAATAASDPASAEEAAPIVEPPATAPKAGTSRRKKRQQKSARARKDKLRSTAGAPTSAKQTPAETPPSKSGWLVPPDRARAFEQFMPAAPVEPAQATITHPPHAPVQIAAAVPVPPVHVRPELSPLNVLPNPVALPQPPVLPQPMPMPRYGPPSVPPPAASAAPVVPIAVAGVVKTESPPVKIKSEPPAGYTPQRRRRVDTLEGPGADPVSAVPNVYRRELFQTEEPRSFPWKLAAAAIVIVAIGTVGGRAYLAGRHAQAALAAPAATPPPPPAGPTPPPKGKGQIIVQTEPAGARVLLDGKPAGESPVTLDAIAPGRHVLTFISSSGTIKRTVRVIAGKTINLEVPVFSGWLALFAPVVLDVSEDGKSLGTTEDKRLMIAPGHHKLALTNRELGYSAVHEVDVDAGQVTSLTIDPRGTANFSSNPDSEVWMDGRRLGVTPLAGLPVPLGVRDFIFKHPDHGERRATITVRADAPAAVSVDFTKQQ